MVKLFYDTETGQIAPRKSEDGKFRRIYFGTSRDTTVPGDEIGNGE